MGDELANRDKKGSRRYVCADCFNDGSIQRFVRCHAVVGACDFCNQQSDSLIAAPWSDVATFIIEGLDSVWTREYDCSIHYHTDDPAGPRSYSAQDLVEQLAPTPPIRTQSVIDQLARDVGDINWYDQAVTRGNSYGRLWLDWDDFWHRVVRKSRFFIDRPIQGDFGNFEPSELPTTRILDELGHLVRDAKLVRTLPSGTSFFRARQHRPDEPVRSASELGPPPYNKAFSANRMSPAGIVMLYGATTQKTALREVYDLRSAVDGKSQITVGRFDTTGDLKVVDLTKLPSVPSIFDDEMRPLRSGIQFLRRFVDGVKKPIARDGKEHLDYVPTQVVTEYFRHVFRAADGDVVRGILYPSSQDGRSCCALFFESDECGGHRSLRLDNRYQWMRLDESSIENFGADPSFTKLAATGRAR